METNVKENKDEIEIDLREILAILLDRVAIIILVGVLAAAAAFAYTKFFVDPVYSSRTQVYVKNNTTTDNITTVNDLQSSNYLTQDYMILVKSNPVMEQVISDLGLKMSASELAGKITVSTPDNTRVLTIAVSDKDPWQAKSIADAVREASKTQIKSVMAIDTVNTVEEGNLPTSPVSPNTKLNVILGALIGMFLTIVFIIVKFMLDDTIKTPEDAEKYLGLSVLSAIPAIEGQQTKKKKKSR